MFFKLRSDDFLQKQNQKHSNDDYASTTQTQVATNNVLTQIIGIKEELYKTPTESKMFAILSKFCHSQNFKQVFLLIKIILKCSTLRYTLLK